jgi:hypothetical protein
MKTPIAVALIIMGGLLIMTPAFSDFLYQKNVVELMSRPGVVNVSLPLHMSDIYRFGCWLTGTGMIGVTVLGSLFCRTRESGHGHMATHSA